VTSKQAEMQQVFRHETEWNTNTTNNINQCVCLLDSWGFLDSGSQSANLIPLSFNGSSCDTVWVRVPPWIRLHGHIASYVIPRNIYVWPNIYVWQTSMFANPCTCWGSTESPDRALHIMIPVSHDRRRVCLFSLLYIKLFELVIEVAC